MTLEGPWNEFRTTSPVRVSQFAGDARFTTAGGGSRTTNHLTMSGLPNRVTTQPPTLAISTGFTVGIGASTSIGEMVWMPREEMPFNGP